jgi:arabinogalactan oligomer / maltooligosaccharide transport system substrate-binding protein
MRQRHLTLSFARIGTIIILLALTLVGWGSPSPSTVTLTYWPTESTAETLVILQLVQQFQQQNPNIKINAKYGPFDRAQRDFIIASQADNAPDVLRSDVGWVIQFASQRYC